MTPEWNTLFVQAENFARRDNYVDAVARLRSLATKVEAAEGREGLDAIAREGFLATVIERLEAVESEGSEKNAAVAARRQARIHGAAEEMARPLPKAPDQR